MKVYIKRWLSVMLAFALVGSGFIHPDRVGAEQAAPSSAPGQVEEAVPLVTEEADASKAVITREQAEKLARQYVNIPEDYTLQGTNYGSRNKTSGAQYIWGLEFVKRVNGKHVGSISTAIDAMSGQLISFYSYADNPSAKPSYPLKVDREAAIELAKKLIGQIAGDYAGQVSLNERYGVQLLPPLTGDVRHSIRFERVVNGLPFVDNYMTAVFNSEGHLLNYQLEWDESIEFPKVDKWLSVEEARQKVDVAAEPVLKYIVPYNMEGKKTPVLSYEMKGVVIDAATGEKVASNDYYYNRIETVSEQPLALRSLAPTPKLEVATEKQAREIVEAAFTLSSDFQFQSSSFNEYIDSETGQSTASWYLSWSVMKDGKEAGGASASVDGKTGAVLNYYAYNRGADQTAAPVTLEEAVQIASETVKEQIPWLANKLYLVVPDPKQYENRESEQIGDYYIQFVHKEHGATVDYDRVSVSINAATGELRHYNASIAPYSYPSSAPATISAGQAIDKWMEYYDMQLTYQLSNEYLWGGEPLPIEKIRTLIAAGEISGDGVELESTVQLVYRMVEKPVQERVFLDAATGEWRNRETGRPATLEVPQAVDAEGHWAEQSLQLMVAYKALELDKEGKVYPNKAITRGEIIKMLVLARSGGRSVEAEMPMAQGANASFKDIAADSDFFAYVESALQQNLIDLGDGTFNPDAPVSREEMAELIVRAFGYNTLANHDHIFKVAFKDADQIKYKGQSAIVVGLKIMSLTNGNFLPKKQVTRGEASIAFFRYLQKRAELQEAPLRY